MKIMEKARNEYGFEVFEGGHGRKENQKLKPYLVLQYLLRQSDENHVISATNIVGYLQEICGIYAERRGIYRDIDEINKAMLIVEYGIDVHEAEARLDEDEGEKTIVYDRSKKGFYVRQRHFDLTDIRLLAECVYSAKFIEKGQADRLVDVVAEFVSEEQAKTIRHDALLTDRVKTDNKSVLINLSEISDALSHEQSGQRHAPEKISFKYLEYTIDDLDKPKERRKGTRYIVSPYRLLINDGNYYLLGYDEEKHKMLTYRVDRMKDVRCMGEPREGEEAAAAIEISKYAQQCFSMFGGQTTRVQIRFINMLLDTVIDRFGKTGVEYAKLDDRHFTITAEVRVSDPFFSWVCTFGRRAKILYPDSVVEDFKFYLDKIRKMYDT
jgi:predicted DNA-binding transcriptional regulator YafY